MSSDGSWKVWMDGPGGVGAQNRCDAAVFTYVYVVVLRKGKKKKKRRILEVGDHPSFGQVSVATFSVI